MLNQDPITKPEIYLYSEIETVLQYAWDHLPAYSFMAQNDDKVVRLIFLEDLSPMVFNMILKTAEGIEPLPSGG